MSISCLTSFLTPPPNHVCRIPGVAVVGCPDGWCQCYVLPNVVRSAKDSSIAQELTALEHFEILADRGFDPGGVTGSMSCRIPGITRILRYLIPPKHGSRIPGVAVVGCPDGWCQCYVLPNVVRSAKDSSIAEELTALEHFEIFGLVALNVYRIRLGAGRGS